MNYDGLSYLEISDLLRVKAEFFDIVLAKVGPLDPKAPPILKTMHAAQLACRDSYRIYIAAANILLLEGPGPDNQYRLDTALENVKAAEIALREITESFGLKRR